MEAKSVNTVILITIDSLRYDFVSEPNWDTTPKLNKFASQGVRFENAIATGCGTSTSFPGLFASSLPLDHGYNGLQSEHFPLAEILRDQGIQTIGVSGSIVTSSVYNYDRGFDVFENRTTEYVEFRERVFQALRGIPVVEPTGRRLLEAKKRLPNISDILGRARGAPYTRADELTDLAIATVDDDIENNGATDRFIWIHYMDPHRPYYPPAKIERTYYEGNLPINEINKRIKQWESKREPPDKNEGDKYFSQLEMEAIRSLYRAEIRFADREIGRLLETLKEREELGDPTVVISADHGDEFLDHGDFGHRPKLYEELIHVPLIVFDLSGSARPKDGNPDQLVSLLDLAPTVTDLLEVDPPDTWRGKSIVPTLSSNKTLQNYVISELSHQDGLGGKVVPEDIVMSARGQRWKYIRNCQGDHEEVYDLKNDPKETSNKIDNMPGESEYLRSIVLQRIEELKGVTSSDPNERNMTDETKKRLSELGYLE